MTIELRVFDDAAGVAEDVATSFTAYASAWLESRTGDFHLVLTGGRTGIATLAQIAQHGDSLDWSRVQLWWGDERWLPAGDAERNDAQAEADFLSVLPIPRENIHRCPASDGPFSLDEAAVDYAAELQGFATDGLSAPEFALVFLGMGPDGHVASLFPHHEGLSAAAELVVIPVRESPKPPAERLSLTMSALNSAEQIWVMLSGADKAEALERALNGTDSAETPASALEAKTATVFFADEAAAGRLLEAT